jgi:hypothetical protein
MKYPPGYWTRLIGGVELVDQQGRPIALVDENNNPLVPTLDQTRRGHYEDPALARWRKNVVVPPSTRRRR